MYFKKKIKVVVTILLIIFLNIRYSYALENKILFKIENEIITTIDIYEEIKFLKKFNQEMNNLSETELFEISKNSILRDKIKKIEIMNFVKELKVEEKYLTKFIKNRSSQKGLDSIENFEKYLRENELNIKINKRKIYN